MTPRPNRPRADHFQYGQTGDTDDQQRAQVALHQLARDGRGTWGTNPTARSTRPAQDPFSNDATLT
jgi:hypothetical protein